MWELDCEESWELKNWCFWTVVLEKTLESPLDCKKIQPVHPEGDQSWVFIGRTDAEAETPNTLATSCEELTHWKRPWCWEGLGAGGEGDDRGWDGWMASLTQWAWVWVNSGSGWWRGRPGMLRFRGSQRDGHDWVTELEIFNICILFCNHTFHSHLAFILCIYKCSHHYCFFYHCFFFLFYVTFFLTWLNFILGILPSQPQEGLRCLVFAEFFHSWIYLSFIFLISEWHLSFA